MISFFKGLGVAAVLAYLGAILAGIAGYFTNIFWLLSHMKVIDAEFVLAAVGVFAAPLGALHGIYTWF